MTGNTLYDIDTGTAWSSAGDLSYYTIANNPDLLRSMTCESGQDLTHSEQLAKLDSLMERRRRRHDAQVRTVNPLNTL